MKMDEMIRFGIPSDIIDLWREGEGECLLPLQELAVKRYGLFGEDNLLVQAPTSSGKTFIGEMAAIHCSMRRKRVVYLAPLKALAEEKYRRFKKKYARYGLKVIVSTRDRREFDCDLEQGDFAIAVVVYEKLAHLLVRRPQWLDEVALIIADELEILSDPDRGGAIEVLLTRILHKGPRLIGLSAVLGEAHKLAQWMGATLLAYDQRPVELRLGVLYDGTFSYKTYNGRAEGKEHLIDAHSDSSWEVLTVTLCEFVRRGEPCLVFVKAKDEARRGAELLSKRVDLPAASTAIEALRELETTRSRDVLIDTLGRGVGFHNADLSPDERRIVENAFRSGELTVLVSTSTLAAGLNLPARNVFITADKWRYDARLGMPWKTPVLRSEWENMAGRAARLGAGHAYGRAILIATTPFDYETLWRRYIEGECEPITPRMAHNALEDYVLSLVASRCCVSETDLHRFLEKTLTGTWVWQESYTLEESAFFVRAAVNRAVDAGVLVQRPDGRLDATPLGLATASKGISISTARELAHWISESEARMWSDLDLILAAALSTDGRMVQVTLKACEYDHADYPGMLKRLTLGENIEADVPMNRIRNCNLTPFFEEVKAIKIALFLNEWIDHGTVSDIEEEYCTSMGQILAAADQMAWLIDATATLAVALGGSLSFVGQIRGLAERVQYGVRSDLLPLVRAGIPDLTRNTLLALHARGLHTAEVLAATESAVVEKWVSKHTAQHLHEWATETLGDPERVLSIPLIIANIPALVVDDRRPGEIMLDGVRIRLQEKQYRLMHILAQAPGECVAYETIYEALWGDIIVEPNQMHFQKRKVLDAIKENVPQRAELIQTVPKRGFILDLRSEEVMFKGVEAAV